MAMSARDDKEALALRKRTLDSLPSAVITVDSGGIVVCVNRTAEEMVPTIGPGVKLRASLEELTNVEKVDRILFHREIATFAARPEGPELHWMLWDASEPEGELVLTVWDTDWSEVINERRVAFTMAASHELRGPLTTIRGFSEILNMQPGSLSPEQAEAARIVEDSARLLSVLVDDIFDLTRSSFGELRLDLHEIDLNQVIAVVISSLEPGISDRGQTLTLDAEELPVIEADESRMIQMISNLVSNASVHNAAGVKIRVKARRSGNEIAITVADDGVGLPFDDPEAVFLSFRRGEAASDGDRTGSGIGVPLTKLLVELHRGRITVETGRGEGTSFTLWLPVDREAALAEGTGL